MKRLTNIFLLLVIILVLIPLSTVFAQDDTKRPVVMVSSYSSSTVPSRGENFNLAVIFTNNGQRPAYNIFIEFVSGELIPRNNGGTQSIYQLIMGESKGVNQGFTVSPDLWGATVATVIVNLEYTDESGNPYSDSFTITIDLNNTYSAPAATATPTALLLPQLVVTSYETDMDILQPGTAFELTLSLTNLGNGPAKAVSMVMGGGSVEMNPEGTPQPGVSGSIGEFTNFAPLNSSNIQYIGDIPAGGSVTASQKIIVNVNTSPGAYSLKYSFIYNTESGEKVVDDQVITLLVYRLPVLEVGFYQDPGTLFAQQPNNLPIQVVNLGKQSVVLGNMQISADDAMLENNTALVGTIETGFYFTLDTILIPNQSGPLDLHISIKYTDDFNQSRVYETTLSVNVEEMVMNPEDVNTPEDGGSEISSGVISSDDEFVSSPETFWDKIVRFIKGLFGLDSGLSTVDQFNNNNNVPSVEEVQPSGSMKGY